MLATVMTLRAPGMHWNRLPIFVWGMVTTAILAVLAAPVLLAALIMVVFDRTVETSFFISSSGGSPFLWDELFWFFGHPEVYILALPGFGIVLEILPVFARKPLWGYRLAVAGMFGVALMSFMVWQHHLFMSGINSDLRPFYMFTTELISIPTGLIFLIGMGTLWKARIRFTVPMLFALAFFFNFLIGGLSGVFLSDVTSDVVTHGSYFVMAHFHYTIMGGLVFALIGGIYFWLPKITGFKLNEKLGKVHFWTMFVFFNLTFFPLFAAGMLGMPRRVSSYNADLHTLNVFVSIAAFCLGALDADLPRQPRLVGRLQARACRVQPVAVEVARVAAAVTRARLQLRTHPDDHLSPLQLREPRSAVGRGSSDRASSPAREAWREHAPGLDRRPRGSQGPRSEPGGRGAPARERRRVLFHGFRVRVLLPARAEHQP